MDRDTIEAETPESDAGESRMPHDRRQFLNAREGLDRGRQVGVRFGLSSYETAEGRDNVAHPHAMEPAAQAPPHRGGFETDHAPAGTRDADHLAKGAPDVRNVAHAPAHGDGRELTI